MAQDMSHLRSAVCVLDGTARITPAQCSLCTRWHSTSHLSSAVCVLDGTGHVTPAQCSLCTGWHSTYHHTTTLAKPVRHQTHGCHYPLQLWELCCHSQHNSHKTLRPDYKQFLHSQPIFWQMRNADGRQTFSIFVTPDTQNCQLHTTLGWHPQSNCFLDF